MGTGIFFILSEAVPEAGPAVLVSFLIAAAVAGLTVLCYAELASSIPSSGSSYSYTYATMGELAAFGVGACLILEYGVSAAAVAVARGVAAQAGDARGEVRRCRGSQQSAYGFSCFPGSRWDCES